MGVGLVAGLVVALASTAVSADSALSRLERPYAPYAVGYSGRYIVHLRAVVAGACRMGVFFIFKVRPR